MEKILVWLADSSIIAGFIILIVLLLRPFIKKLPKRVNLVLWLVVAVRLVMPFGLTSSFSLVPDIEGLHASYSTYLTDEAEKESLVQENAVRDGVLIGNMDITVREPDENNIKTNAEVREPGEKISEPIDKVSESVKKVDESDAKISESENISLAVTNEATVGNTDKNDKPIEKTDTVAENDSKLKNIESIENIENKGNNIVTILSVIWFGGCGILFIYFVFSIIRIRRRTRISVPADIPLELKSQSLAPVYVCEGINSPFITGLFKPKMYIPEGMDARNLAYVIRHENAHIRHLDQIWKVFGFILLMLYWFNPLAWIAFICFTKDLELACDERAVGKLSPVDRAAYSEALLSCSLHNRMLTVCPVAFSETGVKERVKAVISMKKPLKVVIAGTVIGCVLFTGCFLTNPASAMKDEPVEDDKSIVSASEDEENTPAESKVNDYKTRTGDAQDENDKEASGGKTDIETDKSIDDETDVKKEDAEHNPDAEDKKGDEAINSDIGRKKADPDGDKINEENVNNPEDKKPSDTESRDADIPEDINKDTSEDKTPSDTETKNPDTPYTPDNIADIKNEGLNTEVPGTENPGVPSAQNAVIPNGVTKIKNYAFNGENGIVSVSIPDTVEVIGDGAFANCKNLSTVYLPGSIKEIGVGAFMFCSLTSVNIPDSVTKLGINAFWGCKLSSVSVPDSVTTMESGVFNNNSSLKYCRLPYGLTEIPDCTFSQDSSLSEVDFNRNITRIGNNAFTECKSLKHFDIPETVTDIGIAAFCGSGIKEIRIPEGVTVIKQSTFTACPDLERVYLPKSLTRIEEYAFMNCTNLKEIIIPESVTEIGMYSFSKCTSLSDESKASIKAVNKKAKVK
jgi:beta-lactamase regulating signal transducer with metallopeptidase domain